MARISLSPVFIRDSINVFRQRGLKGLLFGTKAALNDDEAIIVTGLENNKYPKGEVVKGKLHKIDAIHKGRGAVYLMKNPNNQKTSLIVFGNDTHIANGPDLWLYLSDSKDPHKDYGNFFNLGLIKGNKGGQTYEVDQAFDQLNSHRTIIIYCKQFDVLFSYAFLA